MFSGVKLLALDDSETEDEQPVTLEPRAAGEAVAGEAIRIAEAVAEAVAFTSEIPAAASRPEQAPRPHPQSVGDKISVLWKPTLTAALQGHVATRLACAGASHRACGAREIGRFVLRDHGQCAFAAGDGLQGPRLRSVATLKMQLSISAVGT